MKITWFEINTSRFFFIKPNLQWIAKFFLIMKCVCSKKKSLVNVSLEGLAWAGPNFFVLPGSPLRGVLAARAAREAVLARGAGEAGIELATLLSRSWVSAVSHSPRGPRTTSRKTTVTHRPTLWMCISWSVSVWQHSYSFTGCPTAKTFLEINIFWYHWMFQVVNCLTLLLEYLNVIEN